jgi:hypothetical protein
MDSVKVVCDRCGGHGIVYTRVENGQPVPAHPDNGVCYKCHGNKVVEPTLGQEVLARILVFAQKHNIDGPFQDIWKDHDNVYLCTRTVTLKFAKYKDIIQYKPREGINNGNAKG